VSPLFRYSHRCWRPYVLVSHGGRHKEKRGGEEGGRREKYTDLRSGTAVGRRRGRRRRLLLLLSKFVAHGSGMRQRKRERPDQLTADETSRDEIGSWSLISASQTILPHIQHNVHVNPLTLTVVIWYSYKPSYARPG